MLRKVLLVLMLLLIPNVAQADASPVVANWQLTSFQVENRTMPAPPEFGFKIRFEKNSQWSADIKLKKKQHQLKGIWALKDNVLSMTTSGRSIPFKVSFDAAGMHVTMPHKQQIIVNFKKLGNAAAAKTPSQKPVPTPEQPAKPSKPTAPNKPTPPAQPKAPAKLTKEAA